MRKIFCRLKIKMVIMVMSFWTSDRVVTMLPWYTKSADHHPDVVAVTPLVLKAAAKPSTFIYRRAVSTTKLLCHPWTVAVFQFVLNSFSKYWRSGEIIISLAVAPYEHMKLGVQFDDRSNIRSLGRLLCWYDWVKCCLAMTVENVVLVGRNLGSTKCL